MKRILLIAAIALVACVNLQAADPPKLKGLLISGGCCHDYVKQKLIISEGLSQRVNIEWDFVDGPKGKNTKLDVYNQKDWASKYDVIVHNECYGGVEDVEFVEKIVKGHTESGVAGVVVHCSMHTYRSAATEEWRKLLGVTTRRHEKGKRQLQVVNRAPKNPIMADFPKEWKTPNGELYIIENVWDNCTPLATAYSDEVKKDLVCMWTNTYGKARIFGTTLGHHNETMLADEWLDTVARGVLWSVDKLGDDGKPVEGYAGTGKAPFSWEVAAAQGAPTAADWSESIKFPASEKPVHLFNGKDTKGWTGQEKYWQVKEGVIVGRNSAENAPKVSTYLLTEKKYRNFRLVFEGKLAESEMHTGVAIWGKKFAKDKETHSYQGHLVMFPSNYGLYDLYRRNSIARDQNGAAKKAGKQHDWNRMEILAIGDRIRFAINGKAVLDWTDPKPEYCEAGPIGLQLHSNKVPQEVQFRGLILSENPEDKLITVE